MLVACWLLPASAWAQNTQAATEMFQKGRELLLAKNYAEACPAFEESQRLDAAIGTQMNIALCYEEWGKIASAYAAYRQAAKMAAVKGDTVRGDAATKRALALESAVPRLLVRVRGSSEGLDVQVDANTYVLAALTDPLPLDPGEHQVTLKRGAKALQKKSVTLRRSEQAVIELDAPAAAMDDSPRNTSEAPVPRRSKKRTIASFAMIGVGVALAGGGTWMGLAAKSDYDAQFPGECDRATLECTPAGKAATDDARKRANLGVGLAGAGGALAIAGVVLFVTAPKILPNADVALTPVVGRDGAGVALSGTF